MSVELFVPFVAKQLRCAPQEVVPERGSPMELTELLWPLVQMFQGDSEEAASIRNAPYEERFEAEVDASLEAWEADPYAEMSVKGVGAAHIFYERLRQALIVCSANEAAGSNMLLPHKSMPRGIREVAAALLMLHRMSLPFKPGTTSPSNI